MSRKSEPAYSILKNDTASPPDSFSHLATSPNNEFDSEQNTVIEEWKIALKKNMPGLCDNLILPELLVKLGSEDVFSAVEIQLIKIPTMVEYEKGEKLITILITKSQKHFSTFIECLYHTNQSHLAHNLMKSVAEAYEKSKQHLVQDLSAAQDSYKQVLGETQESCIRTIQELEETQSKKSRNLVAFMILIIFVLAVLSFFVGIIVGATYRSPVPTTTTTHATSPTATTTHATTPTTTTLCPSTPSPYKGPYLSSIKVHYGNPVPENVIKIWDDHNGTWTSEDINAGFSGDRVYLIPIWTYDREKAVSSIYIQINRQQSPGEDDLSKGDGGKEFRYLRYGIGKAKISELWLYRRGDAEYVSTLPVDGHSNDINGLRHGDFLYLVWNHKCA